MDGCSITNGIERCGCPMLYIRGDVTKYRDWQGSSAAPSYFWKNTNLKAGVSGSASLYQQQLACKNVRNCKFEYNETGKNTCTPMSKNDSRCPVMVGLHTSLAEQKAICAVADKAFKSFEKTDPGYMKRKDTIKGCNFINTITDSAFGNWCKEVTDCDGGCDDS